MTTSSGLFCAGLLSLALASTSNDCAGRPSSVIARSTKVKAIRDPRGGCITALRY
ncbi:hypothetical protein COCSUDRAFT_32400 [Coccomyxa subellipsoidea C-169]|uniref:Uncharacterized protein n=1 Tax=Coccomyxa subellipsoidea (strain C-169) TaxID=574566 RepID=I0Z5D4_COCSC|nr:hypothetical protein COCSUDRAFT_32400 [Coccomyxa subellipsoidea C-169]EIE25853.1 hypothetical protein COCSUDRAFT_32400 [Coccomyxa subellipsoidea C-169]|eukprot:XP_005650397.1 hypothetical protein COCSUDRAFT_32400 [Coccomyxa subellipsoidea C-169]